MSSIKSLTIPFGKGEAVMSGFFYPPEKGVGYHGEFEVHSLTVGGIDILPELDGIYTNVPEQLFIDWLIEKHWDKIQEERVY